MERIQYVAVTDTPSLRCISPTQFKGSCLRQAIEEEMEIQHARIRAPFLDGPAHAVVIQRIRPAEPTSQALLRADIVAWEHMQTAKTS